MGSKRSFSFVVPVNNENVFNQNILSSPLFQQHQDCEIIPLRDIPSASVGYNSAFSLVHHEIIIFCHQDIFFPVDWLDKLNSSLDYLDQEDPAWGVVGCFGISEGGKKAGYIYCNANKLLGGPSEIPIEVQTLDEVVLIVKADTKLRFDAMLPGFHFYGADICLIARQMNQNSYAISALCFHNTSQLLYLPNEFVEGYEFMRKKWKDLLPISTSCVTVESFSIPFYLSHLKSLIRYYLLKPWEKRVHRVISPKEYVEQSLRGLFRMN